MDSISSKKQKDMREGHRQRLRSRFLYSGDKFEEYELLELLLTYIYPRKDTKTYAKILINHFGSLKGVIEANLEKIPSIKGFGPAFKQYLFLSRKIATRCKEEPARARKQVATIEDVKAMARNRLGSLEIEEIWCAFVDQGNRLISWERMAEGNFFSAGLIPRDFTERALALRATGIVVVHNAPETNNKPSRFDIMFTEGLKKACQSISVRYLDYIVFTETISYSVDI